MNDEPIVDPLDLGEVHVPVQLPSPAVQVTATVNQPIPRGLTEGMLAKLAREMVMEIREAEHILLDYKLTAEQYEVVRGLPFFKRVLESITIEWNSALSTHQRLKIGSAAILEAGMPALGARMMDAKEPLPAVVETGKLFAKIAGIGEDANRPGSGEKFTININLGGDKQLKYDSEAAQGSRTGAIEIQANPEGAPSQPTFQSINQRAGSGPAAKPLG